MCVADRHRGGVPGEFDEPGWRPGAAGVGKLHSLLVVAHSATGQGGCQAQHPGRPTPGGDDTPNSMGLRHTAHVHNYSRGISTVRQRRARAGASEHHGRPGGSRTTDYDKRQRALRGSKARPDRRVGPRGYAPSGRWRRSISASGIGRAGSALPWPTASEGGSEGGGAH